MTVRELQAHLGRFDGSMQIMTSQEGFLSPLKSVTTDRVWPGWFGGEQPNDERVTVLILVSL